MTIVSKIKSLKNQLYCWWLYRGRYELQKLLHPSAAFLVLSADGQNLGDHAIAHAAKQLLGECKIKFIEVSTKELYDIAYTGNMSIFQNNLIIINGGGNLGSLWFDVECVMRDVISYNPKSPIVIFPNSIYYEDSKFGREEQERSIQIYNAHEDLKLYAREGLSYTLMKALYSDVSLVPDLVLSLDFSEKIFEREGCILCLRNDLEKTRSQTEEAVVFEQAQRMFQDSIIHLDTVKNDHISINDRKRALTDVFESFAKAQLVITDRLHGMIFAAITGTPCIVIDSRSPKVRGCYEWIKHLEYIKFCDDVSKIEELYRSIPAGPHRYDNAHLQPYYDELRKDIKQKAKRRKVCRR